MPLSKQDQETLFKKLLTSGKKERERFLKWGREIQRFASDPDEFDYKAVSESSYLPEDVFGAKVPKTAEAVRVLFPHLYSKAPHREVTAVKSVQPDQYMQSVAMKEYLNRSLVECNANWHNKRAIKQAIVWGRGVLWTGMDERGIVTSKWVDVRDIIDDPDARSPEQRKWIARARLMKRFELMGRFPDKAEQIKEYQTYTSDTSESGKSAKDNRSSMGHDHDMIMVYEFYTKYPIFNFKPIPDSYQDESESVTAIVESEEEQQRNYQPEEYGKPEYKKYLLVESHGNISILSEGNWEIPFWRDSKWPCEFFDPVESDNGLWPQSLLLPGLGWQKVINYIDTIAVGKFKNTNRDIIAIIKDAELEINDDDIQKIVNGDDLEVITMNTTGGSFESMDVRRFIQQIKFDGASAEFDRMRNIAEQRVADATGLTGLMYDGSTQKVDRSAAATNRRFDTAFAWVEDVRVELENFLSDVARKEALAVAFLVDEEGMNRMAGLIDVPSQFQQHYQSMVVNSGDIWGPLVPPVHVQRKQWMDQQMQMAMQQIMQMMAQQGIPYEHLDENMIRNQAIQMIQPAGFQPQRGHSVEEFLFNYSFQIEEGSTRKKNKEFKVDQANELMNQSFAAVAQIPHPAAPAIAASLLEYYLTISEAPPDIIQQIQQLKIPPPPPQPPGAPQNV